jgi:hypothetical protein
MKNDNKAAPAAIVSAKERGWAGGAASNFPQQLIAI